MALPNILRNFAVHVDGSPKIGEGEECRLPTIEIHSEEYRGGGMDIGIELDLGMKKMDARFKLFSFDDEMFRKFGFAPGITIPLDFYGHLIGEGGSSRRVWAHMMGIILKIDSGDWQAGKKTMLDINFAVHFYKLMHGESELIYIDPVNGVRRINNIDQTADMRANLGF